MLVIRLQRTGKRNDASFRVVVCEKSTSVRGKSLEVVGSFLPTREHAPLEVNRERIMHWISKGAQPSNTLARLLKKEDFDGMDTFIVAYTKQKKRMEVEEEKPAAEVPVTAKAPKEEEVKEEVKEEIKEEKEEKEAKEPEAEKEPEQPSTAANQLDEVAEVGEPEEKPNEEEKK